MRSLQVSISVREDPSDRSLYHRSVFKVKVFVTLRPYLRYLWIIGQLYLVYEMIIGGHVQLSVSSYLDIILMVHWSMLRFCGLVHFPDT